VPEVRRDVRDRIRPAKTSPDEQDNQQPPAIGQSEIVAFSLLALLILSVIAVLYVARAFFLPTVTALVIGTMLSPAAKFFERYGVPRSVSAVLIVSATCAGLAFMVALISAPVMEWTTRLPELQSSLKEKFHIFDRPIALWHQVQSLFGGTSGETGFPLPKIEWVQPTLEFLSPTFTEILLFFAILALRILNAIESNLGGYLLTVTMINMGLGVATGLICAVTGMPNPAGLGALAATLNYIPIIGPIVTFVVLAAVGIVTASTLGGGLVAATGFAIVAFIEGHFITPTIIGRRLALNALAVFLALAFWTWLWGPMGAFLSSPILIVGLVLKEHLMPVKDTQLPGD
jgi:predicted PurR-regulated permease PerM